MGQFKPMIKMFTDEPSVILKLKKGGKVSSKREEKEEHGHKPMQPHAKHFFEGGEAENGCSPKKPSMSDRRKAMNPNFRKGGKVESGGEKIDREETKTTIESGEKKFSKTKVNDGDKNDRKHGTGEVKNDKSAGYKQGGKVDRFAVGGTIEGNEGKFDKTEMHQAKKDKAEGTTGIRMGNAGGFKKGGTIEHDGDWEDRPADGTPKGKSGTKTGEVKESNAGGYKRGGATKKHFATGGNVINDGKAVKMPHHFVSQPVANSLQSGTFKKGGKVKKFSDGGESVPSDVANAIADRSEQKARANYEKYKKQDDKSSILSSNPYQ